MADASGDFAPNTSDDFPPNMLVVVFVGETTLAFALVVTDLPPNIFV